MGSDGLLGERSLLVVNRRWNLLFLRTGHKQTTHCETSSQESERADIVFRLSLTLDEQIRFDLGAIVKKYREC